MNWNEIMSPREWGLNKTDEQRAFLQSVKMRQFPALKDMTLEQIAEFNARYEAYAK